MNLQHHFLIAMPALQDPMFRRSVVYICEYNDDGAMGIIINKPMENLQVEGILEKLKITPEPRNPEIRLDKPVMVGGPLAEDDSTDTALLATRVAIGGATLQGLITKFAPQIAARLMTKAGAQAVPVLGAAAGASINYTFARYYQELARVQFGLIRMAHETGIPREALVERLQTRIKSLQQGVATVKRAS